MLPFFLDARLAGSSPRAGAGSLLAFSVVAFGAVGCVVGGWCSRAFGEKRVALVSLAISGALCLASPALYALEAVWLVPLLLAWGFFVIADSPQFSALAVRHCPREYTGTALTVQNGVGFAVTVVSIQLTPWLAAQIGWQWAFTALGVGPLVGIIFLRRVPAS